MELIVFALCTIILVGDAITLHRIRNEKAELERIANELNKVE